MEANITGLICGILALIVAVCILRKLNQVDRHNIEHINRYFYHLEHALKGVIMSEAQDAVDAVVVQLGKAKDEILVEIANLEEQVAAGQPVNLDALKAAAQGLDDVVPDVAPPA